MKGIRKHRSGAYRVDIPIYDKCLYVAMTDEIGEKLCHTRLPSGVMAGVIEFETDPPVLIFSTACDHNTIAHECLHLVMCLTEYMGIQTTYESHEATAYLMGFVAEKVYQCIEVYNNDQETKQRLADARTAE